MTEKSYPLTPTQAGMLYHQLLDRHSGIDVQQVVLPLATDDDASSQKKAWRQLLERHSVLRTSFRWDAHDQPLQHIADDVELPWSVHDGRDVDEFLHDDRAHGFDLQQAPLMRLTWLRNAGKLVWTFHHSLLDGSSVTSLLAELSGSDRRGAAPPPFRSYIDWLAQLERSGAEEFWRGYLRGFTAPTPLPSARLSAAPRHWRTQSVDAPARVISIAAHHGISIETVVIGAWAYLLSRYSGETDVVFGVARSVRPPLPNADRMIGNFIHTIPVRAAVNADQPAAEWLARLEAEQEAVRAHAQTPLVQIQKWSDVAGGTALFDSLVVFERKRIPNLYERTGYPLTLTATTGDSLSISVAYDAARFDDDTIARICGHLTTLLDSLAEGFEQPLGALPLLTAAERRQLLADWNATERPYPDDKRLHELFEAQAAATPDRIAVRFEGTSLTYRQLNERANRIAHCLLDRGARSGSFVGILMERSPDMVAAVLGTLKAGAAYLPLDPGFPVDRLEFMLEDSQAPVMLTQSSLAEMLAAPGSTKVLLDAEELAYPVTNPVTPGMPQDLAYILYTSGSTGKPKGVQIPHRAVVNFLVSMAHEPGLTRDDVVLAVTTLSFDIAGLELHLPLITGATIDLVSRAVAADGRRLAEVLAQSKATVMQATPATWRMLLEAGWAGDRNLKVLCGGEAMSADLAERLLSHCGSLWNMYGPTETTIWSTVKKVERATGTTVPVGRPIANTQIYLLDTHLQPVPVGVAGELHIGGDGVAVGYLNRPELTNEKFIADPFRPGNRIYKTGDAARYLPNGDIEYLHRLDNQVKLRGYRIELGEIEAALRKHDAIKDAVVTVRSDMPGGKALVGYVIPEGGNASTPELRNFLRESLPDYMVPAYFVTLAEFPLTPNGKVDRRALPPPEVSARDTEETYVAPRNELETRLTAMWSEVLSVPRVGIEDNFFELGGDSLLALRLFMRIEQTFGKRLPLATLLQAATIETLAAALTDEAHERPWSPLVPLQTKGTKPPIFCVHGVGGNVLNYRPLAQHLGESQPFFALQARGMDGVQQPLTKVEDMARLYLEEVRKIQPHGPYLLGGLSFGGIVALEMAHQLREAGEETALLAPFDTMPVNYGALSAEASSRGISGSLAKRLQVHLKILWRSEDRFAYLKKKVRRVWRKTVYKTWQTTFAVLQTFKRRLPQALQNVQQANYLALRDYRPRAFPGRVTFFYAAAEPKEFTREKYLGWSVIASTVDDIEVPGDHLTMLEEPHVRDLAEKLAHAIAVANGEVQRELSLPGRAPNALRQAGSVANLTPAFVPFTTDDAPGRREFVERGAERIEEILALVATCAAHWI